MSRALDFYTQLLPHQGVVRWRDGSAAALVLADGSALGLWLRGKKGLFDGEGGQHVHFAFQIAEQDYDLFKERLRKLGITPDEHRWENGARSLYFFDPDGHQGEFMTCDWLALQSNKSSQ